MIPLRYQLRERVRLEPAPGGKWRVVSESPLAVVTVNAAAARLLEATRHGASVGAMAADLGMHEEKVFTVCEYFRGRGILKVERAAIDPGFAPPVTVIVPTRDRSGDLGECLRALTRMDYPRDCLEVIVVDDGSLAPAVVAGVAAGCGTRLLVNDQNRGSSYSRNRAAGEAEGEILAFVDSDCVAGPGWLRELTPYFSWERVGAVGGRTVGYHKESRLDRYEEIASPLDMGAHLTMKERGTDTFYVPTCNLLVRRSLYQELGGLREDLQVGEDVDLCWRLRARGAYLVYAPEGVVRHKHRNRLGAMLKRRAEYGTSEAALHALHPDKRKCFPAAPAPWATATVLSAALIGIKPRWLPACAAPLLWDAGRRTLRVRRSGVDVPARAIVSSVLRGHASMLYFVYFHLVRYYLGPLAAAGVLTRGVRLLTASAVLYASAFDYINRRPRLGYPTYLGCYLAEHVAYQAGVVAGCVRTRSIRSYLPVLRKRLDRP